MGAVPLDPITPNLVNPNFFDLVMAKKMPLTVDHFMGMDRGRHPDQLAKPRGDDGLLCAGHREVPLRRLGVQEGGTRRRHGGKDGGR